MRHKILLSLAALVPLCTGIVFFGSAEPASPAIAATHSKLTYDKDGNLQLPQNYREWIYLSSGFDMSYTDGGAATRHLFDNVFVNPEAYRSFAQTGTWPDKTAFVLEVRQAESKGSINQRGQFQATHVNAIEVHAKDESRFPGKWAFFEVNSDSMKGRIIPQTANCYSCHLDHGAVDTTFVQFYPTLLPVAEQKNTLSPAFLNESAGPGKQ